jgi:hypothetical protein
VNKKYAEFDLMAKLPFKFLHKVVIPEQVLRGSEDVSISFGMSTQRTGLRLHLASEISREGGELHMATAYLDGQKVTNEIEVLVRLSTYSHLERRMLTVASCVVGTESKANIQEFLYGIKKVCCYDCAWLSLTALSTVTCNLWL